MVATTPKIVWVWGDKKRGIAIIQGKRRNAQSHWWDIHHVKNSKTTYVHRDYGSKAEALREARSYAKDWQKHPRANH